MSPNSFGKIFTITTWGESKSGAIGVVIDGCPSGIPLNESDINKELSQRRPGVNKYVSARKEPDRAEILSGLFDGKTNGAPISIIIYNKDVILNDTELLRPGHANFTYLAKYGILDSGRASARETACRVAAGAIAKKITSSKGIQIFSYLKQVGEIAIQTPPTKNLSKNISKSPIFCPSAEGNRSILKKLEETIKAFDSIGGVVEFLLTNVPAGLGSPIFDKLQANLAKAMLSIPAARGFEIGLGFEASKMKGSEHNDSFYLRQGQIVPKTNKAGGIMGGISTGETIIGRVAFKPTPTINQPQETLSVKGKKAILKPSVPFRNDVCVAIRAVPVVSAMAALVLADEIIPFLRESIL